MQLEQASKPAVKRKTRLSWGQIVARNFSVTMVSGVIDSALRFLAYGYLARRLGPEVFGINAFMFATALFFGSLADFGLGLLGSRDIASHPDKAEELVSTILSLKIVFGAIAYLLMQLFIILTRGSAQVRWLAVIYGLSLLGINTADWILIGFEQMQYIGIAKIANGVGVFVLVLAFVHGPEDLLLVGGIESLTFILAGGYLFYIASKKVRIRLSFQFAEWKALFKEALPLGISLVMVRFGNSLPVFALGLLASDYDLGIFRAVSLLPSFFNKIPQMFTEVIFPTFSRIYVESEQKFVRVMILTQKYLSIGGILLAALGIVLLGPLLIRVYGEEFREGLGTFQILMIVSAVIFSNLSLRKLLPACHAQRQYAFVMTSRTVILLILSLILAKLGSEAEAWALLLVECYTLVLSMCFFHKQFPSIWLSSTILKVVISSGVFALAVWSLAGHPFIAIPVGTVVYGLMLVVLRVVSFNDVKPILVKDRN